LPEQTGPIVVVGAHCAGVFMYVDAVPGEGESVLGWGFDEPDDGGKATNQAMAAARLAAPVAFVSVLGRDDRGDRALGYLDAAGVDTSRVMRVDAATDAGFVLLPPSKIPAIAASQDCSRALDEAAVETARDLIATASVVVCQLEAPDGCALAAFRIGREVGATTILNPAPARPLPDELVALCDVIVPNEHEAAALAERSAPIGDLAVDLAKRWETKVIVTAGGDGAYVTEGGSAVEHLVAPVVDVMDTTGAGDAFVGALATRVRAGDDLVTAARFAVAAASVSVSRLGTIPSYATPAEVVPA
jgi:ribokinase